MSKEMISRLLKLVVIFAFVVMLAIGMWVLPLFFRFVVKYSPEVEPYARPCLIYINAAFIPVYICLVWAWQVFGTIAHDATFCHQNARKLWGAMVMALVDVGLIFLYLGLVLTLCPRLASPFMVLAGVCMMLVGLCAAMICFALSRLIAQAATLKEEAELTV